MALRPFPAFPARALLGATLLLGTVMVGGFARPKPCSDCSSIPAASTAAQVMLVEAGRTIELFASPSLVPGSADDRCWTANWGSVSEAGLYTAPATVPEDGLDAVTYANPQTGTFISLTIRVLPPINPPGADAPVWTPITSFPPGDAPPSDPPPTDALAVPTTMGGSNAEVAHDASMAETVEETYDGTPYTPVAYFDGQPAPTVQVAGRSARILPAEVSSSSVTALYGASSVTIFQAKIKPVLGPPAWLEDPCTGSGLRAVIGSTRTSTHDGREYAGDITVDAALSAKIKLVFGIDVKAGGKFKVYRLVRRYRQWYNKDVYQCVNGEWRHVYSRQCSRVGTKLYGYSPTWASLLYGAPGGETTWSEWVCNNL